MATPEQTGTVTKETMIIVAVAAFVTGILCGIVFSVYKLEPASSTQQVSNSPMTQGAAPAAGIDDETSAA
ncbi:MAG: hypothetical protein OEL55_01785, partial [Desulfobulbaceae bacterium]|nr:hypothetical protein [Desulfobulbaceae bacterium]